MRAKQHRPAMIVTALAVIASAIFGFHAMTSRAAAPASWAPGLHDDVGSMGSLAPVASVPAGVSQMLSAQVLDVTRPVVSTLHLLRSGLGSDGGRIYGYQTADGRVCMVFWPNGLTCPTAAESTPGVVWLLAGGGPGLPGTDASTPPAIAGLVDDSITGVTLAADGQTTRLNLVNNAFFSELPAPAPGGPWAISLRVTYSDGSAVSIALPNPGTGS